MDTTWLELAYFGNTIKDYLISLAMFIGLAFVLVLIEKIIFNKLRSVTEKTESETDDQVYQIFESTLVPLLYLASFYFAALQLKLEPVVDDFVRKFCIIVLTIQIARFVLGAALLIFKHGWLRRHKSAEGISISKSIETVIKIIIWGLAVVFIMDNLGLNVSAIVAGLGIGGVAVAFAAQAILGDLFNYFVIFFDRPFREGDFIIMGDFLGTVERIGIKTTRIRSLGGEQLIFSNTDLTSSRIRNYKRMSERRVLFKIGVTYQTKADAMRKGREVISKVINDLEGVRLDRVHFQSFGDFSLNFEVVYYVLSPDYNTYMDVQQQINFGILEGFEREGLEFAYPTQTLYLNKEN